jgi:hypothetical protein
MVGLYLLFIYCVGFIILGLIISKWVPAFRFTIANIFLFVVGGWLGGFALANLTAWGLNHLGIHLTYKADVPISLVSLVGGALVGGTGLVWLKTRLAKKSAKDAIRKVEP